MFCLFLLYNEFILDIRSQSADENNALIIQLRKIKCVGFRSSSPEELKLLFAVKLRFLMAFVLVGSPQYTVVLLRLLSTTRQNTVMLVINLKWFFACFVFRTFFFQNVSLHYVKIFFFAWTKSHLTE